MSSIWILVDGMVSQHQKESWLSVVWPAHYLFHLGSEGWYERHVAAKHKEHYHEGSVGEDGLQGSDVVDPEIKISFNIIFCIDQGATSLLFHLANNALEGCPVLLLEYLARYQDSKHSEANPLRLQDWLLHCLWSGGMVDNWGGIARCIWLTCNSTGQLAAGGRPLEVLERDNYIAAWVT